MHTPGRIRAGSTSVDQSESDLEDRDAELDEGVTPPRSRSRGKSRGKSRPKTPQVNTPQRRSLRQIMKSEN